MFSRNSITLSCLILCFEALMFIQPMFSQLDTSESLNMEALLRRAWDYSDRFHKEFSNLVIEEKSIQQLQGVDEKLKPFRKVRSLRSDILLVWIQSDEQWSLFRDVYEVDGKKVREREDRLQKLFLNSPAGLDAIASESARYNLGPVHRNFNVPTIVLTFLRRENADRFDFILAGKSKIDGQTAIKVDFSEKMRPTMISNRGQDVFSKGTIWIAPESGTIYRTRLVVEGSGSSEPHAEIEVIFKENASLGISLPFCLSEHYTFPNSHNGVLAPSISGRAEYSNIRKFKIQTEEGTTSR